MLTHTLYTHNIYYIHIHIYKSTHIIYIHILYTQHTPNTIPMHTLYTQHTLHTANTTHMHTHTVHMPLNVLATYTVSHDTDTWGE